MVDKLRSGFNSPGEERKRIVNKIMDTIENGSCEYFKQQRHLLTRLDYSDLQKLKSAVTIENKTPEKLNIFDPNPSLLKRTRTHHLQQCENSFSNFVSLASIFNKTNLEAVPLEKRFTYIELEKSKLSTIYNALQSELNPENWRIVHITIDGKYAGFKYTRIGSPVIQS